MTTTIVKLKPKFRTITLTDRAPVRIKEDEWPVLAQGSWTDGAANLSLRVRQHDDGRAILYGLYEDPTWDQAYKVGRLLADGADLAAGIKNVADDLIERVGREQARRHIREAVDECIADLPAEDLE